MSSWSRVKQCSGSPSQSLQPRNFSTIQASSPAAKLPDDAVARDRILTNVSIYWFTATAGSAAHTYYERFNDPGMWTPKERATTPTAVAVFTTDVTVRPFADKVHNVVRWTEGGMTFRAVSDVEATQLAAFAQLWRGAVHTP